jgi:hypothetical protein
MSNRHKVYAKGRLQGSWTALRHEVMDSAAWKATSFGARALYVALLRELSYTHFNNGKVFLATRDAAKALGARQGSVAVWYHELEHYGFIVMTSAGCLGVEGRGRAAYWRLTDMAWGKGVEATKDYLKWNGTPFRERETKTESRDGNRLRVRRKPSHTPETKTVSGKAKSETKTVSCERGGPETVTVSYLDKPYPHQAQSAHPAAATPSAGSADDTHKPATTRARKLAPLPEWTTPTLVEIEYTQELRQLYAATAAEDEATQ